MEKGKTYNTPRKLVPRSTITAKQNVNTLTKSSKFSLKIIRIPIEKEELRV